MDWKTINYICFALLSAYALTQLPLLWHTLFQSMVAIVEFIMITLLTATVCKQLVKQDKSNMKEIVLSLESFTKHNMYLPFALKEMLIVILAYVFPSIYMNIFISIVYALNMQKRNLTFHAVFVHFTMIFMGVQIHPTIITLWISKVIMLYFILLANIDAFLEHANEYFDISIEEGELRFQSKWAPIDYMSTKIIKDGESTIIMQDYDQELSNFHKKINKMMQILCHQYPEIVIPYLTSS